MDHRQSSPDSGGDGGPPRKELQGPRPTPLKVRKESHKIRKPAVAPSALPPQHLPPTQQPRQPVIIYTVSPKVIHANPNEFMTIVQRLTAGDATSSSSSSVSSSSTARFGSIEKAKMALENLGGGEVEEGVVERSRVFLPGILSPGPASLPPISPIFFNHTITNNNFNTSNYMSTPFSTHNTNFISPGPVISPASLDLLHQILNG